MRRVSLSRMVQEEFISNQIFFEIRLRRRVFALFNSFLELSNSVYVELYDVDCDFRLFLTKLFDKDYTKIQITWKLMKIYCKGYFCQILLFMDAARDKFQSESP